MSYTAVRRPAWLFDERAHAGRENLDADHVTHYDAKEAWDASAEVSLLRSHGLDAGSTVLDIGAGTGRFALEVAPYCARVIAADPAAPMLEQLQSKLAAADVVANVEVVEAGFLSYEHEGAPVDVAYSRYALHHLPDFWKVRGLMRLAQCMRPGGLLRLWDVVYSFAPEEADERVERWCAAKAETGEDTEWLRPEFDDHVRNEHSTFTWLLEPMLERSGFDIQAAEYTNDRMFAGYVARRR